MRGRSLALGASIIALSACQRPIPASDARAVADLSGLSQAKEAFEKDFSIADDEEVRAALARPLREEDAARLALLNNREIRAVMHEVGIARGSWVQARALPNPILEAELPAEEEAVVELGLEYDITEALLAPSRAKAELAGIESARFLAARSVIEQAARARIAFVKLRSVQRRLTVAHLTLATFEAEREALRATHAAGNSTDLALTEREFAYEWARLAVFDLEAAAERARGELILSLGLAGGGPVFEINLEPEALPDALQPVADEGEVLRANFDIRSSRVELDGLAARTGYLRAKGNLPDVSVGAHAVLLDEPLPGNETERRWAFGGGLATTLPLFDRQQGNLLSTEAAFDARLERHVALVETIRSEVRLLRRRLERSHERAKLLSESILPAARQRADLLLLEYNAMQIDVLRLIEGRRVLFDVESAALAAEEEFFVARIEYEAVRAGCLIGGNEEVAHPKALQVSGKGHDS